MNVISKAKQMYHIDVVYPIQNNIKQIWKVIEVPLYRTLLLKYVKGSGILLKL